MKRGVQVLFVFFGTIFIALLFTYVFMVMTPRKEPQARSRKSYSEKHISAFLSNDALVNRGRYHFHVRCAKCHGTKGQGKPGISSLDDDAYNYSNGDFNQILRIIKVGIPGSGMYGWQHSLKEEDLISLAVFVKRLPQLPPKMR